jgi:hypothetical protein
VHEADAAPISVGGAGKAHRLVFENDFAFVWLIDALQHAHQRRFASAVAADDRVDRRRRSREVDAVVGDYRSEPARQPTGAEPNFHLKKSG